MKHNEQWMNFSDISTFDKPFPHFAGLGVLNYGCDRLLYEWLSNTKLWSLTNAAFYTQYEFSLFDVTIPEHLQWLTGSDTINQIKYFFGLYFSLTNIDIVGVTAHQLKDSHVIGIHNDFINGEETHRLLIQINPLWNDAHGGFLMLFNSNNPSDIAKLVRPVNNSVFGFEISEHSFHAVSKVLNYSRYTIVYTLKAS